jgi:hypothetical protein
MLAACKARANSYVPAACGMRMTSVLTSQLCEHSTVPGRAQSSAWRKLWPGAGMIYFWKCPQCYGCMHAFVAAAQSRACLPAIPADAVPERTFVQLSQQLQS